MELSHDEEVASFICPEPLAIAPSSRSELCLSLLLASFMVLLASPACVGQTPTAAETVSQSTGSAAGLDPASLVLELNRAINVLERGLKETWVTRDQYLSAFEKTPNVSPTGHPVTDAKKYVECAIVEHLRTYQVWDEGFPIDFEVRRTIAGFIKLRDNAGRADTASSNSSDSDVRAAEFYPPPCIAPEYRTPVVSAGVATAMLKTKIDPIYPAEALKHNVSGTVVLHVTIGSDGHVAALRVISGPAELHQAALDAVRQWIYRPYVLNNRPIEVETTIDVAFVPNK